PPHRQRDLLAKPRHTIEGSRAGKARALSATPQGRNRTAPLNTPSGNLSVMHSEVAKRYFPPAMARRKQSDSGADFRSLSEGVNSQSAEAHGRTTTSSMRRPPRFWLHKNI